MLKKRSNSKSEDDDVMRIMSAFDKAHKRLDKSQRREDLYVASQHYGFKNAKAFR